MRAASLAIALAACLACSARSDPPAAGASERRHLGDAPAWSGDYTGLNNAVTRQRIHDEYKRHAETASNLWNMREEEACKRMARGPEVVRAGRLGRDPRPCVPWVGLHRRRGAWWSSSPRAAMLG